ncbi:alpha/beta fold hydrolase [Massilia glaciei]|nr:alpha/beta fold hydrolase [Massilia glaciei]
MTPTLVFLPGSLCDSRVWQAVYLSLRADYPCIDWNYPRDDSIAAMATRVLEAVSGPLLPVGLSMGGIVALEMWRQAPHRLDGLALFGTNPGPDTPERRQARAGQMELAGRDGIERLARERLAPAYLAPGAAGREPFTSTVAAMAVSAGVEVFADQSDALAGRADSWPILPGIDVPVLVAYGSADRVCPPDGHLRMAGLLQRGSGVALERAGHLAPLEQAAESAQALRNWLASLH